MPEFRRAMKRNARMLDGIGMFSDDIRDMVRGHVFYNKDCGYVSGKEKMKVAVRYCATGGVWHPHRRFYRWSVGRVMAWLMSSELLKVVQTLIPRLMLRRLVSSVQKSKGYSR